MGRARSDRSRRDVTQAHQGRRGTHRLGHLPETRRTPPLLAGWEGDRRGLRSRVPPAPAGLPYSVRGQSGSKLTASLARPQRQSDSVYIRRPCGITIDSPDYLPSPETRPLISKRHQGGVSPYGLAGATAWDPRLWANRIPPRLTLKQRYPLMLFKVTGAPNKKSRN